MVIYKVIKRVVSHQTVLIEAEDEEAVDMLEGDELTLKNEEDDIEVVHTQPATKEEELEYRKHYPK